MSMLSAMEYPDWIMVAGAVLLVLGFIGFKNYFAARKELGKLNPAPLPPFGLFASAIFRSQESFLAFNLRGKSTRSAYTPVKNAPGSLNLLGWPLGQE